MTQHAAQGYRVCVAPMMDVTDRHCRYFLRLLSPDARLYTEMVTAQAVIHGDRQRLLGFDPAEHPVALQLGGGDPLALAEAARIAADFGYDEINLNVGCPSDRVQNGGFGACLMLDADRVARCVEALGTAVPLPVTVKTRIGVDDRDDYGFLADFVRTVSGAGCGVFIVHARKALLQGLSPRDNRSVPPLRYEMVHRLKAENPALTVVINGGIGTLDEIATHLDRVDGVMLGRKIADDPWFLVGIRRHLAGAGAGMVLPDRAAVVRRMHDYACRQVAEGARLHHVTRHMLGLYHGVRGARSWRRYLSERAGLSGARPALLLDSLDLVAA